MEGKEKERDIERDRDRDRKSNSKTKSQEENKKEVKEIKGRFKKDNTVACKYKEEYCEMLIEFFSQPATRIEFKETYYKGQLTSKIPIVLANEYPTFEMFAAKIGVTVNTLLNWCKEYNRFATCYARAKEMQLAKLTSNALMGLYNPLYAKFEAVNNHNLRDKQEVETNVSGKLETPVDEKTLALIERVERRMNNASEESNDKK